jgi:hypothetical protein
MTWRPPSVSTLVISPERAALASLAATAAVARAAILAAHPDIGSNHPDYAIVRLAELLVVELEMLDIAVATYVRLDDFAIGAPDEDLIF